MQEAYLINNYQIAKSKCNRQVLIDEFLNLEGDHTHHSYSSMQLEMQLQNILEGAVAAMAEVRRQKVQHWSPHSHSIELRPVRLSVLSMLFLKDTSRKVRQ